MHIYWNKLIGSSLKKGNQQNQQGKNLSFYFDRVMEEIFKDRKQKR